MGPLGPRSTVTISESAAAAGRILLDAGFEAEDARRDVSVLARHALGWSLAEWAVRARETAPANFPAQLIELTRRRATHEPVAYITGVKEFYGRSFRVSPAVLTPRPETEILVDAALSLMTTAMGRGAVTEVKEIVDVGTGAGCIAVTLALESPAARVIATDVSADALAIARANADALGARVEFVETPLIPPGIQADLIVSNPPYIPEPDRALLPPDVRDFEPAVALFAGPDGLEVIRELVPAAYTALTPEGRLVMEIGAAQADAVADIVKAAGFERPYVMSDLQGIPRIVVARRR
jgi:release factor glutamine methyltransferase